MSNGSHWDAEAMPGTANRPNKLRMNLYKITPFEFLVVVYSNGKQPYMIGKITPLEEVFPLVYFSRFY